MRNSEADFFGNIFAERDQFYNKMPGTGGGISNLLNNTNVMTTVNDLLSP